MSSDGNGSTEGLVRTARDGDPEAFARLFLRCRTRLATWTDLRMGPLLRARLTRDDVMQETFLMAYRSLDQFHDRGPGSFRRWLLSVAEHRLKDLHKYHTAMKRAPAREAKPVPGATDGNTLLETIAAEVASPESVAGRTEAADRLREAIDGLPDPLREVVILRALQELETAEIAARIKRSPRMVTVLFLRGLRELKNGLDLGPER